MKASVRAMALGLAVLAAPATAAPAPPLKLDAATQTRLGIATAPLHAASRTATVSGFARALDPGPLAQLDSDIATAVAALAASQAEADRTRKLSVDQTVSKQVAEAAAAQARSDALKLQLLRRRVGLEWSPALAKYSDARRGKLIAEIAAGHAALLRVDAAGGLAQTSGSVTLDLGAAGPVGAAVLGPTRSADPRLQSTGLLVLVAGPRAAQLGAGAVVPATVASGAGATGVLIPRAALLRAGGQTLVYIRRTTGDFERRAVTGGVVDPDGLFAPQGFAPGELVVVAGASQLYAAQSTPSDKAE